MAQILHIDCIQKDREQLTAALQVSGHQVRSAASGIEGVRMAEAEPPDLVIVDVDLPDLDGYEVTLRIRGMAGLAAVPVVMLAAQPDERACRAVGADGLLRKPLDIQTLEQLLLPYLVSRAQPRPQVAPTLQQQSQQIVRHLEQKVIELSEANRKMLDMARLRREFLRNITHELATPLTPVIGYLGLLLEGQLGALSPLQHKSLQAMSASAERLRFLIDTLLDMSLLESGSMHFYERQYDFIQVMAEALETIKPRAAEADVRIEVKMPQEPMPARGDSDKLRRAAVHVLDNAVKFTPRGGRVAVEVRQLKAGEQAWCILDVADSGSGVDASQLDRILDAFYQVDGSMTRSHGGVGLGLAFARRVAQAFGGDIAIQSPPPGPVAKHRLKGTLVTMKVLAQMPARRVTSSSV